MDSEKVESVIPDSTNEYSNLIKIENTINISSLLSNDDNRKKIKIEKQLNPPDIIDSDSEDDEDGNNIIYPVGF